MALKDYDSDLDRLKCEIEGCRSFLQLNILRKSEMPFDGDLEILLNFTQSS